MKFSPYSGMRPWMTGRAGMILKEWRMGMSRGWMRREGVDTPWDEELHPEKTSLKTGFFKKRKI